MDNQFKMLPLSFTFLVFIFMVLKLWMRSKKKDSPKNLPPAPLKLPLIGHLHLLMVSLPHHRLTELAKRHGSLMHLQLGELSHIVVSSPEAAKEAASKSLHIGAVKYETCTIIPLNQRRG
ncbi:hypothetical protein Goarm_019867, partial [Gossypium armourianum]|nr:hypothetical protein [Gossypium armourianum]